jgi:hypothetical protein
MFGGGLGQFGDADWWFYCGLVGFFGWLCAVILVI